MVIVIPAVHGLPSPCPSGPAQPATTAKLRRRFFGKALLFCLSLLWPFPILSHPAEHSDALLQWAEKRHGPEGRQRVEAWRVLMLRSRSLDEHQKLAMVNEFVNRLDFSSDLQHWQQPDYWATPLETLASGGGDCEDFSIAKYFTLIALGVAEAKLRMTYVKALRLNQAHMVVTYFSTPGTTPLVLDNLVPAIHRASERPDLIPVYSFNGAGLWLARQRGLGKFSGDADQLDPWRELLRRMDREPR